jgi:hypothetical protein
MTAAAALATGRPRGVDLSRLKDIFTPSGFAEPAAVDHSAMYADAVVHLLVHGGVEKVSMTAVAGYIGQVPSAVKQRSGGRNGFLRMVVGRFSDRWLSWVTRPARTLQELIRLPREDDEVHGLRVWSALCELADGEARAGRGDAAEIVARARSEHAALVESGLTSLLRHDPTATEVALVVHLGDALRRAVAAQIDPLDPAVAADVITWVAHHLLASDWPGSHMAPDHPPGRSFEPE